jgi:hypothetical protein
MRLKESEEITKDQVKDSNDMLVAKGAQSKI